MSAEEIRAGIAAEMRVLGAVLALFAAVELTASALSFAGVVRSTDAGEAEREALFWIPQLLFFGAFGAYALRLRRLAPDARAALIALSAVALVVKIAYILLVFTVGPGREQPRFAAEMELRMLLAGGIWEVLFPALALALLLRAEARELYHR